MMNKYLIYAIALAAIVALSALAGHEWSDNKWQTKWSNAEAEASKAQSELIAAAVKKHNDRAIELEKALNETKQKLAEEYRDDDTADDSADSLSKSFSDSLRRSSSCDNTAATTRERAAAATDRTVYSYLFESAVREAKEYAGIAGQAITRGEACQIFYEKLRGN